MAEKLRAVEIRFLVQGRLAEMVLIMIYVCCWQYVHTTQLHIIFINLLLALQYIVSG